MTDAPVRVGVVRPNRPPRPVAEAEARVIRTELTRRLGVVSCDLRVDGAPVGPWSSRATAAWPADIDLEIDAAILWNDELPPLTALFGRTVDATAADVRARMLEHLGLGGRPLDDAVLDDAIPWRPTDLWLLARRDGVAAGASRELAAFADDGRSSAPLDAAFDAIAASVRAGLPPDRSDAEVSRLRARVAELEAACAELADDADRREAEAVGLIDELEAEKAILVERELRVAIDRDLGAGSDVRAR